MVSPPYRPVCRAGPVCPASLVRYRRQGVGTQPYESAPRSAAGRADVGIGPYGCFIGGAVG